MKKFIKIETSKREGGIMHIFIDQNSRGYVVESFDGKNRKVLDQGIAGKKRARNIAEDWRDYFENIGRGAKITDMTNR